MRPYMYPVSNWTATTISSDDPVPTMSVTERMRMREASIKVRRVYPGPVGEYLAKDLQSWETIGLRFDQLGITARLLDAILDAPEPPVEDAA